MHDDQRLDRRQITRSKERVDEADVLTRVTTLRLDENRVIRDAEPPRLIRHHLSFRTLPPEQVATGVRARSDTTAEDERRSEAAMEELRRECRDAQIRATKADDGVRMV